MGLREQQARMRAEKALQEEQAIRLNGIHAPVGEYAQAVVLIALHNEINKIRSLPTQAQRIIYKRQTFLPKWLPLVEDYFLKGEHYQNEVIGYCLIYLFDIEDFEQALCLADRAIADKQALPEGFKRTIPVFVSDQIFNWSEKVAQAGQSCQPYFNAVLDKIANSWELSEMIVAKWLKFAAQLLLNQQIPAKIDDPERLQLAIKLGTRAFELNHKVGVKNLLERCEMRLNALANKGVNIEPSHVGSEQINNVHQIDFARVFSLLSASPRSLKEVLQEQQNV